MTYHRDLISIYSELKYQNANDTRAYILYSAKFIEMKYGRERNIFKLGPSSIFYYYYLNYKEN